MPLGVDCPSCQHSFLVPDKMSGRAIKCPRCERAFSAAGSHANLQLPPVLASAAPVEPLALNRAVTSNLPPAPKPQFTAPRRGLTRLVLDLPESMLRNVPRPLQGITGLGVAGLAVGLAAWALGEWAKLESVALVLALIGIVFGGVAVAALARRRERGLGLPLAVIAVNVQALIFAAIGILAAAPEETTLAVNRPPAASSVVTQLRQKLKDPDQRERLHAAFALVELAHDLDKSVLDLMALLKDPQKEVRAAAAEALGLIGQQARIAYPVLSDTQRADPEEIVRAKSREALKKIGAPGVADITLMVDAFNDRKQPRQARAAAALVLGLIGSEARVTVPALEEGLKDPDALVRVSAAQALWVLTSRQDEVVGVLIDGLKDFDPVVRAQAAYALIALRGEAQGARGALESALADADPVVRRNAAMALWAIGPAARDQVPKLIEALRDGDAKVRLSSAMALWAIARHKDGIPILCASLKAPDPVLRVSAAKGLHTIFKEAKANQLPFVEGPKGGKISLASAAPSLIESLKDQDGDVRGLAALTLGLMGKDAATAVFPLVAALKHSDNAFRHEAAFALGEIGEAAQPAVRALREALGDRDNTLRVFAAEALFKIDRRAGDVVPTLLGVLKDRDGNVRARAAKALGNMADQAKPALPDLNDCLKDPNPTLRLTAAVALGKIGPAAVVTYPTLDQLAKDDGQPEIKKAASTAMRLIGVPKKNDVKLVLIPALKSPNPNYRAAAAVCLWMLFHEARGAVDELAAALADPDATVRGTAAFALAAIGPEAAPAVKQLVSALKSQGDDMLRVRAAYALGEIGAGAAEAVEPLRKALEDKNASVRLHAAQALWAIDPAADQVVPTLTRLLEEKELDTNLLVAAIETLSKIGARGAPDGELTKLLQNKAVPALAQIIGDGDETLQLSAIAALGAMGVVGRDGVPKLIDMLREADSQTRLAAIDALVKIAAAEKAAGKSIRAKIALASLAFIGKVDANQNVARAANLAMTKIGPPGEGDVLGLIEVARDKNQSLAYRISAAQVLSLVGPEAKQHFQAMGTLLAADEPAVRILAADALGALGPNGKEAAKLLKDALKDEDVNVRIAVVQALGDIGSQVVVPMLAATLQALQNDMEAAAVREAAREALARLKK